MAQDPVQPDNPEAEERPDWLPENFESPQALVESYKEAQRKITEESSSRRALEQNFESLSSQIEALQAQAQQPQADSAQWVQQWEEAYENRPVETMAALAQQVAQAAVQQYAQTAQQQGQPTVQAQHEIVAAYADDALARKFDDWGDYKTKIVETLQQRPYLLPDEYATSPQKTADVLETVYTMVKAQDVLSGKVPAAQTQADLMRTMKVQAQSATGAEGRPQPAADNVSFVKALKEAGDGSVRL